MSIFPLVCINLGLGIHIWDQKPEWSVSYAKVRMSAHFKKGPTVTEHLKLLFASDILFPMACSLTKASQCLSYLRLFPGRTNEIFCHTIILFVTTYTVVCIFIALLQCQPIRAHWKPQTGVECINMRATLTAMAALNSFSDLMIYL